ncbi:hypothetical protein MHW98_05170 [Winkia sp. ACRQY]|uniref:Uncharacterized protein n=1 Tax=Winkia neuii subsp. anitrata TaxID=29318 RepID=A0AB38XNZ9_9ACTO|nr:MULTISPECIES: hypothetical protein [Winkia]MCG7302715.1 hypothetical protein [Winkia sp. ACRQY]MDK7163044.1 hypothetical protein [Winkia sp. UMB3105]MDK7185486.1 hypothetical protein [Winkia sp. UMB1295B]MDK7228788.1 hypothetical protein [Winkia sp. UMB1185]MDK7905901.1 hypothetical protein [Winkia sp. UMB0889B]
MSVIGKWWRQIAEAKVQDAAEAFEQTGLYGIVKQTISQISNRVVAARRPALCL